MKKYIFLLLILLLLLTDCRCQKSNLVVNKIIFELPENILKAAASKQIDLKLFLKEILDKDPHIRVRPNASEAGVLNISLVVSRAESELMLMANLVQKDGEQAAFADIALQDIAEFEPEALKKSLSNGVAYLRQQLLGTQGEKDHKYLAKIKQASLGEQIKPEILSNALRIAGEKKDHESLSYVIKLLNTTDNLSVAHACLKALVELKDANALPAIIDFAEGKPALIRRQAIGAARQLPSKLSAEWLVAMAYGHDDPIVRKEALEGLVHVENYLLEQE